MIDVVFLLLVFFMLASRFGVDGGLAVALAGQGGGAWSGPPRLVEVRAGGVALNGVAVAPDAVLPALAALMRGPDDAVVLRAAEGATMQDLVTTLAPLRAAGFTRLYLVD
jgi:biopolymer transport protein ExbD